jgi:hypothetical protein
MITRLDSLPPLKTGYPGMGKPMEKRNIKRHAIDASTVCSHFTASINPSIYDGKMLNYCEDGMCIESSAEFKKGAIVFIKVKALFSNAGYPRLMEGFGTVSLAEIKWSKPSHDAGKTFFGMSVVKY